jgi:hypothetical protein
MSATRPQQSVYDRLASTMGGTSRPQRAKRATKHGVEALGLRGGGAPQPKKPQQAKQHVDHATSQLKILFEVYGFRGSGGIAIGGRKNSLHDGRVLLDANGLVQFATDCGILCNRIGESDVRMAFERVKLRGKVEVDFNGFQRAVQVRTRPTRAATLIHHL